MHSRLVVLECVPPALGDTFVQSEIQRFVQFTGFQVSQTILHLDHVWPSKRSRWWCVLSAPEFGALQLDPFPHLDELPKVSSLIPTLGVWQRDDELSLALDAVESKAFGTDSDQATKYLLNFEGCAPTALRSWGNQLRGCHCGCRAYALSSDRLASRGLFGLLVKFLHPDSGNLEFRHLHPCEAAALTGFDPQILLDEDMRLGLCGIGQIASPLQACWVFAHIGDMLHRFCMGSPALPPVFCLQALRSWLVHRCCQVWPHDTISHDTKFTALVEFWNEVPSLPMEDLMDPKRWQPVLGFFPCMGMVLDLVIRALGGDREAKDLVRDILAMELDVESPVLEGFYQCRTSEECLREALDSGVELVQDTVSDTDSRLCDPLGVHRSPSPCTENKDFPTEVSAEVDPARVHSLAAVLASAECPSPQGSVPPLAAPRCPSHPGSVPPFAPAGSSNCPPNHGSIKSFVSDPTHSDMRSDSAEDSDTSVTFANLAPETRTSEVSDVDMDEVPVVGPPTAIDQSPQTPSSDMDTPMMHLCDYEPWFPNQGHLDVPDDLKDSHSQIIHVASAALPTVFRPNARTTVADLIKADMMCTGNPAPVWVTNRRGENLALDTHLQPSMTVLFWSKGECGLLPRMPWSFASGVVPSRSDRDHDHETLSGDEGECGLLPRMPVKDEESERDPDDSVQGECGLLPRMPGHGDDTPTIPDADKETTTASPAMCAGHGSQRPTVSPTACWTHPVHVCSSIQSLDPLLQLPGDRLTMLPMPTILSLQQWHAVMHQTTVTQERLALLQTQGSLMADDELRFHLNEVVCQRNKSVNATYPQVAYAVDPLLFTSWIGSGFASGAEWWSSVKPWLPEHFVLVTLARVQQHWIPLQFFIFRQTLHVFTWDEPERDHSVLKPVFEKLCSLMGCNHYVVDRTDRLFHCPDHCGAMAISYLQYVLLRTTVVETQEAVVSYHQDLRKAFELAILKHPTVPKPWIWGDGGEALAARLADVLKEHGVPKDLALSRAHSALKVLGDKEVSTGVPWKQLKQLGNNAKFQFVLPAELQVMIDANKERAVGPKKSQKPKAKRVPKHEDAALDPTKLHVLEGTFRCNGQVLPQIGLSQVGPMAAGVILADAKDAAPYLKGSQPVSSEPLALLILGDVPDQMRLPQTSVSVPCSCSINREPVLLDATMVQLGQHHVAKHEAPNAIILDQIDVATIKFTIFRDETEPDWKEIQRSPVRYLVNHFPLLKLCLQEGCQCGAWHNPSKLATHEVIQDVWRRQFLTKTYKPAKAQDAYCYSVCLRVPEEIRLDLLSQSGHAGTYLEPRTHDAKGVDDEFVVVWAPKLSHSELQVMRQTRPAIIGLARVQERKGLRVRADQAQGVHDLVRPGTMYLPPGSKSQWLCGPFPYGCDRVAISKALDQIKWRARPLQPMMHCPGKGTMWLIVSVDAPPASIIQMAHGEIVLSKHKSTTTDAVLTKPAPVATAETLALCEPKASKSMKEPVDLLQVHDPWKMTPPGLPAPAIAPSAQQSLREMEARIESAVMAKINAAPTNMESDDVQDRITQLEQQVGGIMNKQTQLESTVHETAVQHTNHLGSMQQQINQQSTQLHGHLESHKQSMACMFESQMQQIRQLLSKRSREEGHE